MQTDLFGEALPTPSVKSQHERKKPREKLVFDRKALWSSSGYLPGIKKVEAGDVARATSTADTRCDNAVIERLEHALGLEPKVRKGQWLKDALGFQYRRVGKPFKGAMTFGELGSAFRDLNTQLILSSARAAIEPLFTNRHCWLVINSLKVLEARLRMMDEDEDHQYCLKAFLQVLAQHDFIDNSRSGETIRSRTKRDQMREIRAKQRAEKGLPELPQKPLSPVGETAKPEEESSSELDCDEADVMLCGVDELENVNGETDGLDGFAEFEDDCDEDFPPPRKGKSRISDQLMSDMESDDYMYDSQMY